MRIDTAANPPFDPVCQSICTGLTLGGSVMGDPVKDIIKTAYENGINMFDTAEAYAKGKSEEEM